MGITLRAPVEQVGKVPQALEEAPALGALPLEPGTSSLGLAVGSSATSAPKGHRGLGSSWCALPRPSKTWLRLSLALPLGESTDSLQSSLCSHKSPRGECQDFGAHASPWFTGKATEALGQEGMDLATVSWCLSLCP